MRLFEEYPSLSDDMILIHKMKQDDAHALHNFARTPEIYTYLPTFLYEQKYEFAEKVLACMDEECFATKVTMIMGVYLKSDPDKLIGLAEIYSYKPERKKASIGYRLDKPYWGRGIGTRVAALLKNYLMEETDVVVITAHVIKVNEASAKVLRKIGFIDRFPDILEDWGFDEPVLTDKFVFKRSWLEDPFKTDNDVHSYMEQAYGLLRKWKGKNYLMGTSHLDKAADLAKRFGRNALVVANTAHMAEIVDKVLLGLKTRGIKVAGDEVCPGARPNAPKDDVYRIASCIIRNKPDCIVAIGGGSTIDACKAATALASLDGAASSDIDSYFGTGKVSEALEKTGRKMIPLVAVQTSASSGSHLTKYANVTDPEIGQKKLIVDPAIVPSCALFDYSTTCSMPAKVTIDGALDALSHTFEVFCGAKEETFDLAREIAECAFSLVLSYAKTVIEKPDDLIARDAIGLATDLGGYAIMIGGTSGGHLTSFSMVDVAGHGTACGIMNPYYAVFYEKAIQRQLRIIGRLFAEHGYFEGNVEELTGKPLAEAVARAWMNFSRSIGAPVKLSDLDGFSEEVHISRAVKAAKDPDLKMKLQNMPVSMTSEDVEPFMKPLLLAATRGDLSLIVEM